jgi:UDP-N-acetylglucosamine acyltransferase
MFEEMNEPQINSNFDMQEGISTKFTRDYANENFRQDGNGNLIHKTATISHNVMLGKNNYIGANCYLVDCVVGDDNRFEAFCSIGTPPEFKSHFAEGDWGIVFIGDNNVFREFVTINAGTKHNTTIGNNSWFLKGSHVGHDSLIMDKCTLSCNALVGGHSILMEGVNMGLGAICHQFSILGSYSMLGMGTIVVKKSQIKPFNIYVGNPATYLKPNHIAVERNNFKADDIKKYQELYEDFKNRK